ncbi:MAG: 23S rRNA (guanosine(2251)-2'-O)-methyltransferase RlmB [Candidatus Hydrogenedentes bacterium]|nr:23S rRNA (guanosine(2251)-2'-O)-methyltransferase RlmB [Candidatus Hydrogenedentota bacterium]
MRGAKDLDDIRAAAQGVPIEESDRNRLDQLSGGVVHQGVVLEADLLPLLDAGRWAKEDFADQAVVIILDGVEDPHNFGAIVRSAAACGANAVVFGKDRSAPLSSAAMKSAAGAMEYIDLVQATNISRTIDDLKKVGFWIAGLDADGEKTIWQADLKGRIALVVGSEGKGIRRLVREHCDFHLRIPLSGPITSLNASVSAAIAIAECLRQRQ